jgi:hypothetical protein
MVFSTQLCENVAHLTFSIVSSNAPPPLPYVNKYPIYTYTVCRVGGYGVKGGEWTDKHLPQCPFIDHLFLDYTNFAFVFI